MKSSSFEIKERQELSNNYADTPVSQMMKKRTLSCTSNTSTPLQRHAPAKRLRLDVADEELLQGIEDNETADRLLNKSELGEIQTHFESLTSKILQLKDIITENHEENLRKLSEITAKLQGVDSRLVKLEECFDEKIGEEIKVPKELSRKVKTLYHLLPADEQWDIDEIFTSPENEKVSKQFVLDVFKDTKQSFRKEVIRKACHTYFKSLKKEYNLKTNYPEKHKVVSDKKKLRSRRVRLWENRNKHVRPEERPLWKDVTQEIMSDEEDVGDSLKVKTPGWRSEQLTTLIQKLDERHNESLRMASRQPLKKLRVDADSPMKRKPSKAVAVRHISQDD